MTSGGYGMGGLGYPGVPVDPGEAILAQARQGMAPPIWRVWRANPRFFYVQAGLAGIFVIVLALGIVSLLGDSRHAYVLGSAASDDGVLDASSLALWRTIDFAVCILGGGALFYAMVRALALSASAADQLLVLLPEGFVLGTGKTAKPYFFANFRAIKATNNRGTITLALTPAAGGRDTRVPLDARFGKSKPIAEAIMQAQLIFMRQFQGQPYQQPYQQAQPPR